MSTKNETFVYLIEKDFLILPGFSVGVLMAVWILRIIALCNDWNNSETIEITTIKTYILSLPIDFQFKMQSECNWHTCYALKYGTGQNATSCGRKRTRQTDSQMKCHNRKGLYIAKVMEKVGCWLGYCWGQCGKRWRLRRVMAIDWRCWVSDLVKMGTVLYLKGK